MEYQHPPIPVQQFCIRRKFESAIPGTYLIAFNDQDAQLYDQDEHNFLSVIVPKCPPSLFDF